jgi:hypothetical protein
MPGRGWFERRVTGIKAALTKVMSVAADTAWGAAAIGVFVLYPLALSIVEDRVIARF